MKNDLIERYIYAVVKRLPEKKRKDISDELSGLIDDMLIERCGDVTPSEQDIRVVLTELGNPYELAEKYSGDGKKCLIGAPYYSTYKLVLKIVLICAAFGSAVAAVISELTSPSAVWYSGVGEWIAVVFSSVIQAFAIVTLIFAFFYHKDIKINTYTGPDSLPTVPKKNERISKAGSIVGICISIVFGIVFLFVPEVFCIVISGKPVISILDSEAIRSGWYFIVLFMLLGIVREIVKLIEGRYNFKVMVSTLITNAATVVISCIWLLSVNIMNPSFTSWIPSIFEDKPQLITTIISNFQIFLLGVIIFALAIDTVEAVVRYLKNR